MKNNFKIYLKSKIFFIDVNANVTVDAMKNYLQSIPNMGSISLTKSGDCANFNYLVKWYSGGDKSTIIVNITSRYFLINI